MEIGSADLVSIFEKAFDADANAKLEEYGIVVHVEDTICKIYGLKNVFLNEVVEFDSGNSGMVMQIDSDFVTVFLFDVQPRVSEKEFVKRTGKSFKIPVGPGLVGRVINARGKLVDGLEKLDLKELVDIEAEIAGVMERMPISQPLETGMIVLDALIPIGRGQRELIIGNRSCGKTTLALDMIINQKDKDVICVYVAIGQRHAQIARAVSRLEQNDALKYTIVVDANSSQVVLNQYVAPYVGCSIAEYFRSKSKDVLIIYDDLSNHAIAFREMALLMKRSPGREAYPGDVFYLHSRLLERAGRLLSGYSITAIPIVTIQNDDMTAYIPTNLISITDGQIVLDTKLFNQGILPAVNTGLSVSRVGGAAQTKAIKKVSKSLRLELAQYNDLEAFSQFGTDLDEISLKKLHRGVRIIEILKQEYGKMYYFVDQVLILFLLKENILDKISVDNVRNFAVQFCSFVKSVHLNVYNEILNNQDIDESLFAKLRAIVSDFEVIFVSYSS